MGTGLESRCQPPNAKQTSMQLSSFLLGALHFLSLQVEDTSTSSTSRQYILYCIVLYCIILYYIILYYICMLYTYWITNVYIWKYNIAWTRNKLDSETSLTGDHCAPFHSEQDNTRSELKREIVQINNHSWWIRLF